MQHTIWLHTRVLTMVLVHRTFTNYTIFTSKLILGQYLVLEHKLSATYGVLQTHVRATRKYVWTIEFCTFYFFGRIIILSVHKLLTSEAFLAAATDNFEVNVKIKIIDPS